jgi:glycosyltransferase involved in cell wall biosynthesis
VIGWSGSHSTSKYLHLLDEVFQELAKKSNFKLVVMGDANFKVPGVEVEAVEWDERHEIEVIRSFDIGVYPLPNEEWVYGKSGLKALQYMALGVPTIATAIGTIFRIIKQEENGFLVSTREEWKHTLLRLMYSQSLREQIGASAVFSVRERFSVDANKASYISILHKLTDS